MLNPKYGQLDIFGMAFSGVKVKWINLKTFLAPYTKKHFFNILENKNGTNGLDLEKIGLTYVLCETLHSKQLTLFQVTEQQLISACRKKDRKAQKLLYDRYSPAMMGVCRRYVRNIEDAEDIIVEAFYKVFINLKQFKSKGSFEGWIRRIVVNESLMFLRKRHNFNMSIELDHVQIPVNMSVEADLAAGDIMELLATLPTGYRTIFNLYVIEGYKHREIAEILGISINTSKSQLILAKKKLRALLEELRYPGVG